MSTDLIKSDFTTHNPRADDDDVADPNDPRAAHIGTIRVEIKFIQTGKIVPLLPVDAKDVGLIHEKAKKAGIHTTT